MTTAVYQVSDGKILRTVKCPASMVDIQCQEGEEFYLNCPPGATHIIGNEPVTVIPEIPLGQIKLAKRHEINSARDNEELQPFEYLGKRFDADEKAMKRLTLATQAAAAAIMAGQTFVITWTCADNSTIDLDQAQMLGVLEAMMRRGVALHEKARALKAEVDSARTPEEVGAVVW